MAAMTVGLLDYLAFIVTNRLRIYAPPHPN